MEIIPKLIEALQAAGGPLTSAAVPKPPTT
jgi:hypothetical protein